MSRVLKFRAWHRGYEPSRVWKSCPGQMLHEDYAGQCFMWSKEGQPVEIMQFTGILDKNGKEIYEGDVVELGATADLQGATGKFRAEVMWDSEDLGFFFATTTDAYPHIKPWHARAIEIIGNIYENPELREGK